MVDVCEHDQEFSNTSSGFEYSDQNLTLTDGTKIHGPFVNVARTTVNLLPGQNFATLGSVSAHGADYFAFNIGGSEKVMISFNAIPIPYVSSARFGYAVLEIKN